MSTKGSEKRTGEKDTNHHKRDDRIKREEKNT